jgi:CBS domain containing-hemolysin-like protein
VILSAFFSSAETALTTVNVHRMRALAEDGSKKAERVLKLKENSQKLLSTILIGNNIVNISASSIATTFTIDLLKSAGVSNAASVGAGISTGVMTILVLIFGEISPKTAATLYAEQFSLLYVDVIRFLSVIFTPVAFIIEALSTGFLKIFRIDRNQVAQGMTERELRTIVDVSHEDGVLESEEHEFINNVMDFGDSLVKDVMMPKVEITFASTENSYDELAEIFLEDQYSRLPVYEDNKDRIVGILYLKDLYFYKVRHREEAFDIHKVMREPFFTYEHQKISTLMQEMRKREVSFAIVLDEYGDTAGLITLEDILEELVGDMRDEYDSDEKDSIICLSEGEYQVEGSVNLDDLNDVLGTELESEDYNSVGGHIIELLDDLPEVGEIAVEDNITYKVLSLDKNRIDKVYIKIDKQDPE